MRERDDVLRGPVLVFGGSGAVGRFLLRRLAGDAVPVIAISRQPQQPHRPQQAKANR